MSLQHLHITKYDYLIYCLQNSFLMISYYVIKSKWKNPRQWNKQQENGVHSCWVNCYGLKNKANKQTNKYTRIYPARESIIHRTEVWDCLYRQSLGKCKIISTLFNVRLLCFRGFQQVLNLIYFSKILSNIYINFPLERFFYF